MTYYHGTSEEGAAGILQRGLLCDRDQGIPQPTDDEFENIDFPYLWDGVWVTDSVDRARDHGSVVLTVDIAGLEVWDEAPDVDYVDVCVVGSIPAARIERMQ